MNDNLPPTDDLPEMSDAEDDLSPASSEREPAKASDTSSDSDHQYVVVARRYRPQVFDQLIGQEHVAQALSNAIASSRVGHAYIFTGVRGVGKTSAARIFAKALNCVEGPTPTPCNRCEICQGIVSGDDIDVLEIDGASNRGIDEIRSLRQNVGVRPNRARYKIYIIDEVHMLTTPAFNALLKTLEEPPEHVKFIFCTTEPNKIPVTILSRCQRFDFMGITSDSIMQRLRQIVDAEGVEAEDDALRLLAQRATGSMRDSQSLLEQVIAFSSGKITVDQVHSILGTAGGDLMGRLVEGLVARDASAVLQRLDEAIGRGIDPGQLLEQLFGYYRDLLAAACGCAPEQFQYTAPTEQENVTLQAKQMGLSTIMAAMQMLDQTLSRMRVSLQSRILAELVLVRICNLEELDRISDLIADLRAATAGSPPPERPPQSGQSVTPPVLRNVEPVEDTSDPSPSPSPTTPPAATAPVDPQPPVSEQTEQPPIEDPQQLWLSVCESLTGSAAGFARDFDRIEMIDVDRIQVQFKQSIARQFCERPEVHKQIRELVATAAGRPIQVEFDVVETPAADRKAPVTETQAATRGRRLGELAEHPFIKQANEIFGAEPVEYSDPNEDLDDE